MKVEDHALKKWRHDRDHVVCPACGADAVDASERPRWRCPDERCPFAAGWVLQFADMQNAENTQMVAVPVGDDFSGAVPWPRR